MHKLEMTIEEKTHPYQNELSAKEEIWSSIKINVVDKGGIIVCKIIDIDWDARPIVKWFYENKAYLLEEFVPLLIKQDESIAKVILDFYELTDVSEDHKFDEVFGYRERHGLRFGLRGVEVDDVYIGRVEGYYTVSCATIEKNFNYEVDLRSFLQDLDNFENIKRVN